MPLTLKPIFRDRTIGWTGGQYSLYRVILGLYLLVHFLHLLPWAGEMFSSAGMLPVAADVPTMHAFPNLFWLHDGPWFTQAVLIVASGLCVLFMAGKYDRTAAILLWYIWACLLGRNPLILNPGIPYIGWLLLAHAFLPAAPYGSLAAKGRTDPDNGWRVPWSIFFIAWLLMAIGYIYAGYTKFVSPSWIDGSAMERILGNPLARPTLLRDALLMLPPIFLKLATWAGLALELAFLFLAAFRLVRPWVWLAAAAMHLGIMTLIAFADLSIGMLMLHLFTFNPAWLAPRQRRESLILFYDGTCALCHGFVRFVLAEDHRADAIRVAALQGSASEDILSARRDHLPDSIVVRDEQNNLHTRSDAVILLLDDLGGLWRVCSWLLRLLPRFIRDKGYDGLARVRKKIMGAKDSACPLMPPHLRKRFLP